MIKIQPIVGHAAELSKLESDCETGNVAHAYLFSGSRHIGKMAVARHFTLKLLTHGLPEDEKKAVRNQIERMVHPDVLVLDKLWMDGVSEDWDHLAKYSNVPQQHRAKKKAKTDVISIDDIRNLQERLYETGTGTWRCCLIRSIERMQDPAANALLKILEEPPPGLVFLLTTQALPSLLPTLISRSRVVRFHRVPNAELAPLLSDIGEDDAQFILDLAQGAPGTVIELRDNSDTLRERRLMHAKALSFWKVSSVRERMQLLAPLHKRSTESDRFLLHLWLAAREKQTKVTTKQSKALVALTEGLHTNAHRQLLAQEFALSL